MTTNEEKARAWANELRNLADKLPNVADCEPIGAGMFKIAHQIESAHRTASTAAQPEAVAWQHRVFERNGQWSSWRDGQGFGHGVEMRPLYTHPASPASASPEPMTQDEALQALADQAQELGLYPTTTGENSCSMSDVRNEASSSRQPSPLESRTTDDPGLRLRGSCGQLESAVSEASASTEGADVLALADAWVVAAIHKALSIHTGCKTSADPDAAREAFVRALAPSGKLPASRVEGAAREVVRTWREDVPMEDTATAVDALERALAAPTPAPEGERKPLTTAVADALRPFLAEGQKVIWREAFRWKDDNGVMPNHYEMFSLAQLAEDFGYTVVVDCECAGIIATHQAAEGAQGGESA